MHRLDGGPGLGTMPLRRPRRFPVLVAIRPALQGGVTEGDILKEALAMIRDAMRFYIEMHPAGGELVSDESDVLQADIAA